MKRYLAGAAAVGCLLAFSAGTAGATVSYDVNSQSGFIGRGDVIAAGGKGALIANPVVAFTMTRRTRLTCTWQDSTQLTTTLTETLLRLYNADTRYAGNGTVTGYFLSQSNEFDSEITPPFLDVQYICSSLRGVDEDTPVTADTAPLSTSTALTFFGPSGSFSLGF